MRPFAVGPDRFAAGQHRGIDLAAPPGARVLAACGGRVSFAGRVPRGGRTVSVRCGSLVATYQHLGSVAVARGQIVMAGGRIGRAGRARPAPHVHLGARVAATGEYRDPLALFAGAPRGPLAPIPAPRRAPPVPPPRGRARWARRPHRSVRLRRARARAGAPRRAGAGPRSAPAPVAPAPAPRVVLARRAAHRCRRGRRHRVWRRARCRGRCGWGSRSSRSGCRSAAGSWSARRRRRFEPRPGRATRAGSLSRR